MQKNALAIVLACAFFWPAHAAAQRLDVVLDGAEVSEPDDRDGFVNITIIVPLELIDVHPEVFEISSRCDIQAGPSDGFETLGFAQKDVLSRSRTGDQIVSAEPGDDLEYTVDPDGFQTITGEAAWIIGVSAEDDELLGGSRYTCSLGFVRRHPSTNVRSSGGLAILRGNPDEEYWRRGQSSSASATSRYGDYNYTVVWGTFRLTAPNRRAGLFDQMQSRVLLFAVALTALFSVQSLAQELVDQSFTTATFRYVGARGEPSSSTTDELVDQQMTTARFRYLGSRSPRPEVPELIDQRIFSSPFRYVGARDTLVDGFVSRAASSLTDPNAPPFRTCVHGVTAIPERVVGGLPQTFRRQAFLASFSGARGYMFSLPPSHNRDQTAVRSIDVSFDTEGASADALPDIIQGLHVFDGGRRLAYARPLDSSAGVVFERGVLTVRPAGFIVEATAGLGAAPIGEREPPTADGGVLVVLDLQSVTERAGGSAFADSVGIQKVCVNWDTSLYVKRAAMFEVD